MAGLLLKEHLSPAHLFLVGGVLIPAYLFQPSLSVRILQTGLFGFLATRAGKRIKWMYFVIMVGSITLFNLVTPFGEILWSVGPFVITAGALRAGLQKGFTIVGLVFISLFSIRPDLRIPGRLGGLIGRVFYYFERIMEGKKTLRSRAVIAGIDDILENLYDPSSPAPQPEFSTVKTTRVGVVLAGTLLLINWVPVFYPVPFRIL